MLEQCDKFKVMAQSIDLFFVVQELRMQGNGFHGDKKI